MNTNNNFDNIPQEIKQYNTWVAWKEGKMPINPNTGYPAKANDSSTWGTFEQAVKAIERYRCVGVGFMLDPSINGIFAIDIDKCIDKDTGEMSDMAKNIISHFNSYTEISPSGTGIHIFCRGKLPFNSTKKSKLGLEVYDRTRYLTVTGDISSFAEHAIADIGEERLVQFNDTYFCTEQQEQTYRDYSSTATEEDIIRIAKQAKNGDNFNRLFNGDITGYPTHSEADMALMCMLAFYTGKDRSLMDSIFRKSDLYREKYDKKHYGDGRTYGQGIIDAAIDNTLNTYNTCNTFNTYSNTNNYKKYKNTENAVPYPSSINEDAFYGLAGKVVKAIEPNTEADPVALLITFLTAMGTILDKVYFQVGATKHYLNLFTILVGDSAIARKGTSLKWIRHILRHSYINFSDIEISGLSTGEGLIYSVRDAQYKLEEVFEGKGKNKISLGYENRLVDEGVEDKRKFVIEEEFASVLKVMSRDGNTLSTIIRNSWDKEKLQTVTKSSPLTATNPHISMVGHITRDELRMSIKSTELLNGFANRYLWATVKRSKILPHSKMIDDNILNVLVSEIKDVIAFANREIQIKFNENVEYEWSRIDDNNPGIYQKLTTERRDSLDSILARSNSQVVKLAALYAILDKSEIIKTPHMNAALAVWNYCVNSTEFIFGTSRYDTNMRKILEALQDKKLTQTQIYKEVFNSNVKSEIINTALSKLSSWNKIVSEIREIDSKKITVWKLKK